MSHVVTSGDPQAFLQSMASVSSYQQLQQGIFDDYTQDGFEAAFSALYDIEDRQPVPGSERTLYLLRRR